MISIQKNKIIYTSISATDKQNCREACNHCVDRKTNHQTVF